MRCRTAERYISLKLDNELAPKYAHKLDQHLARCISCKHIFEETKSLQNMLKQKENEEYPSWMHQRIMHNLPTPKRRIWLQKPVFSYATTGMAVALSLYMGIMVGVHGFQESGYLSSNLQTEASQLRFGENSLMELYDE